MPGILFDQLVERFVRTLERQGASVLIQGNMARRPASIRVATSDGNTDCILYLWTITPGGGSGGERPAHERRIQITGVTATGFPLKPGTRTIIGGFSPEAEVWGFWDARRHSRFSPHSPSLQVHIQTLETAGTQGIATQRRPVQTGGSEVVAGVAPDSLLWYVQHGEALHNADEDAGQVTDLIDAGPEDEAAFIDESQSPEQAARRVELVETLRRYRDAKFRPAVLQAYSYRCAVCGTALKLVDAAHILPVSHPRSTDEVTNGIALCRQHHGAYDNALLGIQSTFRIVLNTEAVRRLEEAGLHAGLDLFREALPRQITLPVEPEIRPAPEHLRLGLEVRQFPPSLIA